MTDNLGNCVTVIMRATIVASAQPTDKACHRMLARRWQALLFVQMGFEELQNDIIDIIDRIRHRFGKCMRLFG